jgi:hypothetical protein
MVGAAPCQCHSPWRCVNGVAGADLDERATPRLNAPMPSVTCTVWPTACACQLLRAPGQSARRSTPHPGRRLAPGDHVEPHVTDESIGAGLTVGSLRRISTD